VVYSFAVLLLLQLSAAIAIAEERKASKKVVGSSASELVEQLGDDSLQVRDQASKSLVRLGSAARGALQQGIDSANAEVRQRCEAILAEMASDEPQPKKTERVTTYLSNIEKVEETRNHLNGIKDDYFELFIEDVVSFSDEEIDFIIPELIKLLKNDSLLPGGPKSSSGFQKRVFHRADHALSLVAGVSLVNHFAAGGYPALKVSPADLEGAWQNWWKAQTGKKRKQWLEDRRPTYNRQLKNALSSPTYRDYDVAKNALYLMVALRDKPAATDLLAILKVELAKLKIRTDQYHFSQRTDMLTAMVYAIGQLENPQMVPDLVRLAKICNRPEIAYQTNMLRAFASTMIKLTGKNADVWKVKKFKHVSFATSNEGVEMEVDAMLIRKCAFAIWLESAKQ
jgi:hypothetical protein